MCETHNPRIKNAVEEILSSTVERKRKLYDADPNCEHDIVTLFSGVKCSKCRGWFCL